MVAALSMAYVQSAFPLIFTLVIYSTSKYVHMYTHDIGFIVTYYVIYSAMASLFHGVMLSNSTRQTQDM